MKEGKVVVVGVVGGYYDLQYIGKYEGLLGVGYFGDLFLLVVNDVGVVDQLIIVLCLKMLVEVKGKVLMVYVGGDNMVDSLQLLGGGGEWFVCGVIKQFFC